MDDDDETSVLGEGSTCKVVKADYINPYTRFSIKVAVKIFLAKAGCTNVDVELAKKYAFCKNEAEILLEIESKLGAQSTDRMTQVIGIVNGKLPSSFLNWLGRTNRLGVGLIMRLEAGGSMSNFLSSAKLQSYRMLDRVSLVLQLSRSVAEIHEVDVVHGDIKPSNVLISEHYPPLLRLSDFGEAKVRHNSLADSTLVHTASNHGTPLYSAPEMLSATVRPTRKTDVYALGFVCWEILSSEHKIPLDDLGIGSDRAKLIDEVLRKGSRPKLTELHPDTPPSLSRLLHLSWHSDRLARPTALEFYTRVEQCYNVLSNSSYDIFFSHPWKKKSVLRHAKRYLNAVGYKVWYDEDDIQWDLVKSMRDGVAKSKVVLACISRDYENSQNCMFELRETCNLASKPIVTLATDANPFSWAGTNTTHGDLKQMCGISGQGKLFFDIGEICARPGWDQPDDAMIPPKHISDLRTELDKLIKLLQGSQLNIRPTL